MRTKAVHKHSFILLVVLAAASVAIEPRKLPLSILVGGLLALANFKGMTVGLDALLRAYKPTMRLMFLSVFRLIIIMTSIIVLAWLKLVNLLGLLAGFTTVIAVIVVEGYRAARSVSDSSDTAE